jgi:hypothetical protein
MFRTTWDGVNDFYLFLSAVFILDGAILLLIFCAVIHHFWPTVFPKRSSVSQQADRES